MIVDAATFARLSQQTEERVFDGEQVLIPDAVRLVALKLHAARSATRRPERGRLAGYHRGIASTANQDIDEPALVRPLNAVEVPKPLRKSGEDSPGSDSAVELSLPVPNQPLKEWSAQQLGSLDVVSMMETLLAAADLGPRFEADRIASKSRERFRM